MSYEWDAGKGAVNARKHGVHFADAVGVCEDPMALTVPDEHLTEEHWLTLGMDLLGRLLGGFVHDQRRGHPADIGEKGDSA